MATSRTNASRDLRASAGFTLIEILTLLVLLSIAVALAVPRIDFDRYRMQGAMRSIGTHLLAAQRQAVQEEHNVVVAFDSVRSELRIHSDRDNDVALDEGESVRVEPLGEGVRLGRGGAPGVPGVSGDGAVSFTRTVDGLPAVVFHRNGSASEEGALYLTSPRASSSGDRPIDGRAVRIERATGRISWLRYDGSEWIREH